MLSTRLDRYTAQENTTISGPQVTPARGKIISDSEKNDVSGVCQAEGNTTGRRARAGLWPFGPLPLVELDQLLPKAKLDELKEKINNKCPSENSEESETPAADNSTVRSGGVLFILWRTVNNCGESRPWNSGDTTLVSDQMTPFLFRRDSQQP